MELFVKDLVITCDIQDKTSTTLVPSLQKGTQPLELHVQALLTVKTFTNSLWRSYYGNWEFLRIAGSLMTGSFLIWQFRPESWKL